MLSLCDLSIGSPLFLKERVLHGVLGGGAADREGRGSEEKRGQTQWCPFLVATETTVLMRIQQAVYATILFPSRS